MKLFGKRSSAKGVAEDSSSPEGGDGFASEDSSPPAEAIEPMQWWSQSPETEANPLSKLTFWWVQPLFSRAAYLHKHGQALSHDDLIPLAKQDEGKRIGRLFEEGWRDYETKQSSKADAAKGTSDVKMASISAPTSPSTGDKSKSAKKVRSQEKRELERHLNHALFHVMGRRLILAGFIKVFNSLLQFTFPILLNEVLKFVEQSQASVDAPPASKGYWLSALLLLAMGTKAITENWYFHHVYRCGFQAKVAISAAVYEKSLRLNASERGSTSLGELVNLMQVDASKIETFIPQIHVLWDGMLQIIGYMTILYTLIGWPCFVGMFCLLMMGPLQGVIMKKLFALNRQNAKHTDARVKTTNEAIMGISAVKMYTWEGPFGKSISESRGTELSYFKRASYLRGTNRAIISGLPGVVAAISIIVYATAAGGTVSASILFAALTAFGQLRFPLIFYPFALAQLSQAKVSVDRVAKFLSLTELSTEDAGQNYRRVHDSSDDAAAEITVENATIYWSDPTVPVVSNVKKEDAEKMKKDLPLDVTLRDTGSSSDSEAQVEIYPKAILSDVSLRVGNGKLTAIIGRVGSGKSSLCSAILNETILSANSKIEVKGSVAYAAQSAWILNATVRDNILFGLPYDKERYERVLEACQLTHDLSILNEGDMTEIGERGINLSGGQKQRVSIARAAFSDADCIIFDDPLSALDPKVAEHVFNDCVIGLLKGKTILFVTNQLQFLRRCDSVVLLGDGRVVEQGSFSELMEGEGGEVRRLMDEIKGSATSNAETEGDDGAEKEVAGDVEKASQEKDSTKTDKLTKETGKLTTKEERMTGAVKLGVYLTYLQAGGGFVKFFVIFMTFILVACVELAQNASVSLWTADSAYERNPLSFYTGIYAGIAVALGFVTFVRVILLTRFGVAASKRLHDRLLKSILRAPLSFFDTTPTGRIISRFSKDFYSIDQELSEQLDFWIWTSLTVIISLGTITFATPWFGLALVPLMVVYITVLNYFRDVSRETKRLDSISRSPIYASFSETLGGLSTIRAYHVSNRFIADFHGKIDQNTRAYFCIKSADRWLSIRLELIGATIGGLAAFFACFVAVSNAASGLGSDSNFASVAGLSLSYAISVTGLLNWSIRSFAQLEASMNSVERVEYYSTQIPQEAPATVDELEKYVSEEPNPPPSDPSAFAVIQSGGMVEKVPTSWPMHGSISINNLFMRYRKETPIVLKGLNVKIKGGDSIGIVGRTGSGKSSLLLALMRLVEPDLAAAGLDGKGKKYEAPIEIDNVDALRIGLSDLRKNVAIIPQNPVLFAGTIRSNLDPFDEHSDKKIWDALAGCGMDGVVGDMPDGLMSHVAEYGENWSQGQRQMLCLGRALLRNAQILFLDEATSSVDFETDQEIQRTIRTAFADKTVLTIAHRVNTILDSEQILVMKDGIAAEFAPPQDLLKDPKSHFSEIVRAAQAEEAGH